MQAILKWFQAKRWRASLAHCIYGLGIQVLAFALTHNLKASITAVVAWFWAKEREQHIYKLKGNKSTYSQAFKGWFPWEWGKYPMLEFLSPSIMAVLVAYGAKTLF